MPEKGLRNCQLLSWLPWSPLTVTLWRLIYESWFVQILKGRFCYYLHLLGKGSEVRGGGPKSQKPHGAAPSFRPRQLVPESGLCMLQNMAALCNSSFQDSCLQSNISMLCSFFPIVSFPEKLDFLHQWLFSWTASYVVVERPSMTINQTRQELASSTCLAQRHTLCELLVSSTQIHSWGICYPCFIGEETKADEKSQRMSPTPKLLPTASLNVKRFSCDDFVKWPYNNCYWICLF